METNKLPQRIFFLEAARTLAAFYVFTYHILQRIKPENQIVKILFSFGQESVMLFFVLSGFVIYYSQRLKGDTIDVKKYLVARFTRIYPVFIFALLIAYLSVSFIEMHFVQPNWSLLFENIFMLQDFGVGKPGVIVPAYMGNGPLWSLSYEWWFYLLFLPVMYVKPRYQIHSVAFLSILSLIVYLFYPNQICLWLAYFIIWWMGVEAAKKYYGDSTSTIKYAIGYLIAIILILFIYTIYIYDKKIEFGIFPILFLRHFSMALLFYIFLIFIDISTFKMTEKNILVRLAPYSYAFYVLHYSILNVFDIKGLLLGSIYYWILFFLLVAVITWFAEDFIHKTVSRLIKKVLV